MNRGGSDGTSNVRSRGGRDKSRIKCYNCNIYGHYAAECRKPKRTRDVKQEALMAQTEDDEPALLLAKHRKDNEEIMLNETNLVPKLATGEKVKEGASNVWYLDNGTSNHMTGDKEKFVELDEGISGLVKFGDGSTVRIEGKGSIIFRCKNGEERKLHEVFYIPTLCSNIISLGQMLEEGKIVVIKGEYLWVFEEHGKLLIKVKRSPNRLYKLLTEIVKPTCLLSKIEEVSKLWHTRLGHVNYQSMVLMNKMYGLPDVSLSNEVCKGCLRSKQTKKSFPQNSSFSATRALQLVHGYLCGPIEPATSGGNKYFFLLVDDFSRVMWVYMLKSKNEALGVFKKFRAQVEDGDKKKIKVFRTDRGGEFISNDFKTFCEDVGIERHFTTPYTPQQNGVVERRNRTVVEMARSYLKEMNLPMELWGEAVRHSVSVLNRLPTRALSDQTPYEAWTGLKPNIGHIRVFGCLTHMKIPNNHTTKLADRSMEVVNLGREPGTKGYRLYDPVSKRVLVSRDVIFDEDKSWPWGQEREDGAHNLGTFSILDVSGTEKEDQTDTGYADGSEAGGAENNTPPHSPVTSTNRDDQDESGEPRRYRSLVDVYNETEPVEAEEELMFMGVEEPQNFEQAVKEHNWRLAMQKELESIEKNDTWKLTELPDGHKVIDLKWIFKLKKDASGKVVKNKAILVTKGYVQEHGIDFEEIFAPVTRLETVRLLLALSAKNNWEVHHLDVKTAFLNGDINEEVYVAQPKGYVKKGQEKLVYKLSKALYGYKTGTTCVVCQT